MRVIATAPVGASAAIPGEPDGLTRRFQFRGPPVSRRWPLLFLLLAGCSRPAGDPAAVPVLPAAEPATLAFHTDLDAATREAVSTGKPLCVFLVLGDWNRHC